MRSTRFSTPTHVVCGAPIETRQGDAHSGEERMTKKNEDRARNYPMLLCLERTFLSPSLDALSTCAVGFAWECVVYSLTNLLEHSVRLFGFRHSLHLLIVKQHKKHLLSTTRQLVERKTASAHGRSDALEEDINKVCQNRILVKGNALA